MFLVFFSFAVKMKAPEGVMLTAAQYEGQNMVSKITNSVLIELGVHLGTDFWTRDTEA